MPPRVLIAGLFHETHTFLQGVTPLAAFERRTADELLAALGDGSPLGGALEIARERGWDVLPAVDLRAAPSDMVADEVVEHFWNEVSSTLERAGPETLAGIYLVLHGAMASESYVDVEGEIISRLRNVVGKQLPICGVLDLHGNISSEFASGTQGFVAYRQNPHADACEAARDGARLLDRLMTRGEHAVTLWQHSGVMWPPTGTGTSFEPMASLERLAREIEKTHPEILAVNVFAGFSFADTPDTGVSFTAVTVGNPAIAARELQRLADYTQAHREEGNRRDEPLALVLDRLADELRGPWTPAAGKKPIILAEPSDNIGGGAPGDGVMLLQELLARNIDGATTAINDPAAVAQLATLTPGATARLSLGGRGSRLSGGAIDVEVELVRTGSGRFELEDPHSHLASMCGHVFDMGLCAVVRAGGVTILITSNKTPPFDLAQWRSQGIIPEAQRLLAVKAAVAHRKVYDPILAAHYSVDTPGPCSSDVTRFPFRHLRRPIYPLD